MFNKIPTVKGASRTLLITLGIALVVVIYSYGWTVTDISLEEPQKATRQENVQNSLRELFSPNIFSQENEIIATDTGFLMNCAEGTAPVASAPTEGGTIALSDDCGERGDEITVLGTGFVPDALAQVRWIPPEGDPRPRENLDTGEDTFTVGPDGNFAIRIEVPSIRGTDDLEHRVEVRVSTPIGAPTLSNTTREVLAKMIETIFLALIATTLSIPISVVLSFFAAHNLMRSVTLGLGNTLVSLVLFPVGILVGIALLGPVGQFAVRLGQGLFGINGATPALILVFGTVATAQTLKHRRQQEQSETGRWRGLINKVVMALVMVFVLGLAGGLMFGLGEAMTTVAPPPVPVQGELSADLEELTPFPLTIYLGNFVGTVGELIGLLIIPIAGVMGGFSVSSIGSALTIDLLKKVETPLSNVLGLVLGALGGAIVLGFTGVIGASAALLGLLNPIIAAAIAAPVLPLVYERLTGKAGMRRQRYQYGAAERSTRKLLSLIGAVGAFAFTFIYLNVGRAIVEGTLPGTHTVPLFGLEVQDYVARAMVIGAVLGGAAAGLAGTRASFPLGNVLYTTTRTILNVLRSIEPLIMGIIFVIWVGIGPFAGVLALTLHSIASLGKLYSEQLESIDNGPIEALESTGANRLQTIMYGAVPQIIPPYIAFTMYRWDINVRMSTIIGFVGGGGIGFLLQQQLNLLRYREAGVAVLAIAVVVSILDYASAAIRERYV